MRPPEDMLAITQSLAKLDVHVVYSSDLHLDVLPNGVNKGLAARFLAERLGIPDSNVVVCGDSGNDRALFEEGFPGIVVGNAQNDLRKLDSRSTYFAQRHFADGVLEGIRYFMKAALPA